MDAVNELAMSVRCHFGLRGLRDHGDSAFNVVLAVRSQLINPARTTRFVEPDQPDASSPTSLKKIIRFRRRANHRYYLAHPPREEGRIAIVTDAGLDAVDAAASGAIVVAGRVLP